MDHYELNIFFNLCKTLHFKKTSMECNVSPSALSRTIMRIEEELGLPLFERDNRTVRLTQAGERVRDYAARSLEDYRRLKTELLRDREVLSGEISLYASVTACYSILPEVLTTFRNAYPEIHILLKTGDAANALDRVRQSEADISVAALPDSLPKGLISTVITMTPLIFIAPRVECALSPLLRQRPLPWEELPLILPERGLSREWTDNWFREKGIRPRIYAQVSGNEAILAMVSLGCGIAVVPELVIEKSPIKNEVEALEYEPELKAYRVGLAARDNTIDHPLINAFWTVAQSCSEKSPAKARHQ